MEAQVQTIERKDTMNGCETKQEGINKKRENGKHPLEHSWSFWYYENVKGRNWEENQREVTSFCTVEDFWCLYKHVKTASEIKSGCDYSVFKTGIRPMWEDNMNAYGGRWIYRINNSSKQPDAAQDIDRLWLDLLLCMLGGGFGEYQDSICGAVLSVRNRETRISVWTADVQKKKELLYIGNKMKQIWNISEDWKLAYESHEVAEKKQHRDNFLYLV